MFFYLICNASIGNYQESKKKYLTTFIYGTIIYILLHAFLHTSSSQIAIYLKSYFWVVVVLDCAAMYYLYAYLNESDGEVENTKTLKSLLSSFYGQLSGEEQSEPKENAKENAKENQKYGNNKDGNNKNGDDVDDDVDNRNAKDIKDNPRKKQDSQLIDEPAEPMAYTEDDTLQSTSLADLPSFVDDQASDSGSDVDLDNFEMTLQ